MLQYTLFKIWEAHSGSLDKNTKQKLVRAGVRGSFVLSDGQGYRVGLTVKRLETGKYGHTSPGLTPGGALEELNTFRMADLLVSLL